MNDDSFSVDPSHPDIIGLPRLGSVYVSWLVCKMQGYDVDLVFDK